MLTFLTPSALFGLLLLAVPVVVHLFKPRKMRRMPFSSLRWLHATQQRLSRRIQWHQLLLFAVRAAFIVLLVLALAHPLVGGSGKARPVDRYVVLDISRSMGYQLAGQPTPLARGKEFALAVLNRTEAGDRAALLFTALRTRLVMPLTPDPRPFLPALQGVSATASDTRLGSALTVLRPMLAHAREEAAIEIYFVTDLPRQGWSQPEVADFVRGLPQNVQIRIVSVGVAGAKNAWVSSARLIDSDAAPKLRVELGACGEQGGERTLRVSGLPGEQRSLSVTPAPEQVTAVEFTIPPGSNLAGKIAHIRLDPPDALPGDDELFVHLDGAGAVRVLLVEPPGSGTRRSRLHLRDALEAQIAEGDRKLILHLRSSSSVTVGDVDAADVVLLAGVADLPEGVPEALRQRVRAGAGLMIFLSDAVRPPFYNTRLFDPLNPGAGLLPCPLGTRVVLPEPSPPTSVRFSHRLLAPHHDPLKGDLLAARLSTCYRLASPPGDGDTVLARLSDDTPLLVEHPVGAGRVLLFNTSASDDWGSLPRRASFVPLVDQAISYLTAGGVRRSFTSGEPVVLALPGWKPGDKVIVRTPESETWNPPVRMSDTTPLLRLDEATTPGVYQVTYGGDKTLSFLINAGREDALLSPADPAELMTWWSPASVEIVQAAEAARQLSAGGGRTLWPWLIAAAVVLLLLETYLVHALCPRVNPSTAEVLVRRGSLLRPTATNPPH